MLRCGMTAANNAIFKKVHQYSINLMSGLYCADRHQQVNWRRSGVTHLCAILAKPVPPDRAWARVSMFSIRGEASCCAAQLRSCVS